MYGFSVLLHVLAATVWTGGHLVLALGILPNIIKTKNIPALMAFEERYERVGIPSLIILVVTGFYQAFTLMSFEKWFDLSNHASHLILCKIVLLVSIVGLAMHARLRLIPQNEKVNLNYLAFHIILVTVLSVVFVIVGMSFRYSFV